MLKIKVSAFILVITILFGTPLITMAASIKKGPDFQGVPSFYIRKFSEGKEEKIFRLGLLHFASQAKTEFHFWSGTIDFFDYPGLLCGKENLDQDGDGITNDIEKYVFGTDPNNQDTDSDGYTDLGEIIYGYSPFNSGGAIESDSDQDGLSDESELFWGTDIDDSDSDNDSYKDGIEARNNYSPLSHSLSNKPEEIYKRIKNIMEENTQGCAEVAEHQKRREENLKQQSKNST